MSKSVDVAIIGSGTAGLSALREVRKATDKFLLINDGHWGTTCAAVGCMPSKALIEAANAWHERKSFEAFGISGKGALSLDIPAVLRRVRRLRDGFVKGPESVREELGARAISGRASLAGPNRIRVNAMEIRADKIILATGSSPVVPQDWRAFGKRILTTDTLFKQEALPPRMAVVGLGAIGTELAQALARLGIEVTGCDTGKMLAGISDPEVAAYFEAMLSREVSLQLGSEADLVEARDGSIALTTGDTTIAVDGVLAAMGRRPNLDGLGLETLGIELDEHGVPPVDPGTMRIGDMPVFLAGDANGDRAILHEAADDGHIAGRNAVSAVPTAYRRRTGLAITFTSPGIARVGTRLADLKKERIAIGSVDFAHQGRARMGERNAGLMRIYADADTGCIQGAEMCVPAAEHLAHLLALAIEHQMTAQDVLSMPFYHPVLEEGLRGALRDLARQLPGRGGSDLAQCPEVGFEALD